MLVRIFTATPTSRDVRQILDRVTKAVVKAVATLRVHLQVCFVQFQPLDEFS